MERFMESPLHVARMASNVNVLRGTCDKRAAAVVIFVYSTTTGPLSGAVCLNLFCLPAFLDVEACSCLAEPRRWASGNYQSDVVCPFKS